jgi:flagellar hook-basal body complex protein FliE
MTSINAINNVTTVLPNSGSSPKTASIGGAFGETLQSALTKVDSQQEFSSSAVQDLLTGNTSDALPVVSAMAKADLSFNLLIGVRNKVIEAYKQTMNMQV